MLAGYENLVLYIYVGQTERTEVNPRQQIFFTSFPTKTICYLPLWKPPWKFHLLFLLFFCLFINEKRNNYVHNITSNKFCDDGWFLDYAKKPDRQKRLKKYLCRSEFFVELAITTQCHIVKKILFHISFFAILSVWKECDISYFIIFIFDVKLSLRNLQHGLCCFFWKIHYPTACIIFWKRNGSLKRNLWRDDIILWLFLWAYFVK